jgi:hypothetical protein
MTICSSTRVKYDAMFDHLEDASEGLLGTRIAGSSVGLNHTEKQMI